MAQKLLNSDLAELISKMKLAQQYVMTRWVPTPGSQPAAKYSCVAPTPLCVGNIQLKNTPAYTNVCCEIKCVLISDTHLLVMNNHRCVSMYFLLVHQINLRKLVLKLVT